MAGSERVDLNGKITIDTTSVDAAQDKLNYVVNSLKDVDEQSDQKITFNDADVKAMAKELATVKANLKNVSAELSTTKLNLSATSKELATLKGGLTSTSGAAGVAGDKMLKFGRQARTATQNASYQVQDIAVQLAAGTNKLTIISQQIPQLLGGFGVYGAIAGAVVGIGAAIARSLVPQLLDAKSASEKLISAQEGLESIFKTNKKGVISYTDEFKKLVAVHEGLAEAQRSLQLKETQEGINSTGEAAADAVKKFEGFNDSFASANFDSLKKYREEFGSLSGAIQNLYSPNASTSQDIGLNYAARTVEELKDDLKLTEDQAISLGEAISNMSKGGASIADIEALSEKIQEVKDVSGEAASKELLKLDVELQKIIATSKDLTKAQKELKGSIDDVGDGSDEAAEKFEKLAKKLKEQADLIGKSKSESLDYAKKKALLGAETANVTEKIKGEIEASYNSLIADAKKEESISRLNKLKAAQAKSIREATKAAKEAAAFSTSDDPYDQAAASRDADLTTLSSYSTLSDEQVAEKRLNIISAYNERVRELDQDAVKQRLSDLATYGDQFEQLKADYALSILDLNDSTLPEDQMAEAMDRLKEEYLKKVDEVQSEIDAKSLNLFGVLSTDIDKLSTSFGNMQSSLTSIGSDTGAMIAQKAQEASQIAQIGVQLAQGQVLADPSVPWYVKLATATSLGLELASLFTSLAGFSSSSTASTSDDDYSYSNDAPDSANTSGITGKSTDGSPIYINLNTSVDPITGESLASVMTNDKNVVNSQVTNMSKNKTAFGLVLQS